MQGYSNCSYIGCGWSANHLQLYCVDFELFCEALCMLQNMYYHLLCVWFVFVFMDEALLFCINYDIGMDVLWVLNILHE